MNAMLYTKKTTCMASLIGFEMKLKKHFYDIVKPSTCPFAKG